jgi:hypothetical protein
VTVAFVEPAIEPDVAVILAEPTAALVAMPDALMVAMPAEEELHVTEDVMSCVVPSLIVPVAVNCCLTPSGIDGLAGATAMETTTAAVIVRSVEPAIEPEAAVILAEPIAALVAMPDALMVAKLAEDELHVTDDVRSCLVPSLIEPVAVNCCLAPSPIEGFAGETLIAVKTGGGGGGPPELPPPPPHAVIRDARQRRRIAWSEKRLRVVCSFITRKNPVR